MLQAVAARFDHEFEFTEALIGGAAIDATGSPLPPRTIAACRDSDAVLLGAVGGPQWSDPARARAPGAGPARTARHARPVREPAPGACARPRCSTPRRSSPRWSRDVDIMVVRELTGGIYFGRKKRTAREAEDVCSYTTAEIERVTRVAGQLAMVRSRRLVSVDKANVLETSRLWREVVERVVRDEFPQVALEHMLVDAAAMHLLRAPRGFDVLLTENMFGDILTDEASMLAGSLGLLPSASLGSHAGSASTSRSTARRPTSPDAASRIPTARSSVPRCCCDIRSDSKKRRAPSRPPSAGRWTRAPALPTWPARARAALGSAAVRDEVVQLLHIRSIGYRYLLQSDLMPARGCPARPDSGCTTVKKPALYCASAGVSPLPPWSQGSLRDE